MCTHTKSKFLMMKLRVITEKRKAAWAIQSRNMKKLADLGSLGRLKSQNSI
jgi:hypothetical protein